MIPALQRELPPMLRLAGPVVLAELGWMAMGLVDTMMVGHVSATAIGAVSIGGILFYTVAIFGAGMMLGLDTLVSQSYGAGQVRDCHRSLVNALYLCLLMAPIFMVVVWAGLPLLARSGIDRQVMREAVPYLRAILWSTVPLLFYFAFRRYLQGMNLVNPIMFALISANLVHLLGNWIFIYGNAGAPAMGAEGAGWATCFSRIYMAGCLITYTLWHAHTHRTGLFHAQLTPDLARLKRLLALGLPAALQISIEIGVFALTSALIGRLNPIALAAHQIALNCASVTFMVPLGIGSAAAVRVGQALGRKEPAAAAHSGWTAILLGAVFMALSAVAFLTAGYPIVRLFTTDPAVVSAGVTLLSVAAFFQLFDGIQTVATGALRGLGDTRSPMFCHLIAYWLVGLPIGIYLCFSRGWGATGLWTGLCVALILIGSVLFYVWVRKIRALSRKTLTARA